MSGAAGSAAETVLLLLWLILLAAWDIKEGRLPVRLLAAGGGAGMLLRIIDLISGEAPGIICSRYLPGLAAGALLLAAARITREAVGYGDGICFGILAFWIPAGELFTLLFTSLLLCSVPGLFIGIIRGKKLKALPFLPFVAGAFLLLLLLGRSEGASP